MRSVFLLRHPFELAVAAGAASLDHGVPQPTMFMCSCRVEQHRLVAKNGGKDLSVGHFAKRVFRGFRQLYEY
jgi:hypothetical protein